VALLQQDRLTEAEAALRRAIEMDDDLGPAYYHLSSALDRMGRPAEAAAALQKAAERLRQPAVPQS
jgi:tetratricopeptide (TPR) repeat protein